MEASDATLVSEPEEVGKDASSLSITSLPTPRTFRTQTDISTVLDSYPVLVSLAILTAYAAISDDLRILATDKTADMYFFICAFGCFVVFGADLVLSWIFKPDYRCSFYSLFDLLSAVSMLLDIGWLWDLALGLDDTDVKSLSNPSDLSSTSHASLRLTRIFRFTRFLRLIRLSKLYKTTTTVLRRHSPATLELRAGSSLTDITVHRMTTTILIILLIMPLLELETYLSRPTSYQYGLKMLCLNQGLARYYEYLERFIEYHVDSPTPLIYLSNTQAGIRMNWMGDIDPDKLRLSEKYFAIHEDSVAIFDLRANTQLAAGLSLAQTVLVTLIMTFAAANFTRDIRKLVVKPLTKILSLIRDLAADPLSASPQPVTSHSEYETTIIVDAINSVGTLLAITFGEAGKSIIADSMSPAHSLNITSAGRRVNAIFGFCDIRNFTDVTEVLKEGIMTFVNEVAVIVHSVAHQFLGAANKNVGDAFLVVWKYLDSSQISPSHLADLSLLTFLKILLLIRTHISLQKYKSHPGLQQRLPGFTVKLGCGLHSGWAIEGAIGSELKIDASYLSPHVNLASRLEAATKHYGTPLILSENVFNSLSSQVKPTCKLIDRVKLKGSGTVLRLFTYDIDINETEIYTKRMRNRAECKGKREKIEKDLSRGMLPGAVFLKSKIIRQMRVREHSNYPGLFKQGVAQYLAGDWEKARKNLTRGLALRPKDGPTVAVLEYMGSLGFEVPEDWKGYHELLEK